MRLLGYLWALPTTLLCLLGLALLWFAGQIDRLGWREGALEWSVCAGSLLQRRTTWAAITLGFHIIYKPGVWLSPDICRHERVHVTQNLIWGPFFMPAYTIATWIWGYQNNPFERAAR